MFYCNQSNQCMLFSASTKLLKVVENEISLEQAVVEDLPKISSFQVTVENSVATLMRMVNQEEVKVQLDANSAIEVSPDEMDVRDEGEDYDSEDQSQEDEDEAEVNRVVTSETIIDNSLEKPFTHPLEPGSQCDTTCAMSGGGVKRLCM